MPAFTGLRPNHDSIGIVEGGKLGIVNRRAVLAVLYPGMVVGEAAILIGQGDIAGARERIQAADPDANPPALLALAETFDPNMLAAWAVKGVHADVDRARLLYQRALSSGVAKARQRLEALE